MKKFINRPEVIVSEMIDGFLQCRPHLHKLPDVNVIACRQMVPNCVGVVIGNGSGHEPACIDFVGQGALDANAYGSLFAAPGPKHQLAAIKAADRGRGVVVLISNHAGDRINSFVAIDWAREDGIDARGVLLYDDVLSAPADQAEKRRGTAGTLFNYRMAGAYAQQGHSIEQVIAMVEQIRDATRTVTIAGTPGISPLSGQPMFDIAADEYQIGIGVHGEAAAETIPVAGARTTARQVCDILLQDGAYRSGDQLAVLVNGCGGTTQMELWIFYHEVQQYLAEHGILCLRPAVGSFITVQEMGGIALAFCRMTPAMQALWQSGTQAKGFAAI